MTLKVGMKVHSRVGDGVITEIKRGLVTLMVDDPRKNHMALYHVAPVEVIEEFNGMSDLERVLEYYTQDRDAGHEEPWAASYADLIAEAYKGSALEYWNGVKAQWGAERALYSRQLQDANKRIHELEAELRKMREDMRKLMHAAAHPPQIEDEPVAFPARALRFSV